MANVLTLVQDTLYSPEGALVNGFVYITNAQTMTDADGNEYPQGTTVTVNVVDGALSIELTPNIGATPADTYYIVTYSVSEQRFREYWVVPGSPNPANLADVRTLVPPTPTPMFSIQQVIPPSGAVPGEFLEWTGEGWETSPASGALSVNGTPVSSPNLDNTTPAAPAGKTNVTFQTDGENISAYVPTSVPTPPGGSSGSIQFNNGASGFGGLVSFYVNPVNGEVFIIDTASIGSNLAALSVQGDSQGDDIQDWYLNGSTIGDGADLWIDEDGNFNTNQPIKCTQYGNLNNAASLYLGNASFNPQGFYLVDNSGNCYISGTGGALVLHGNPTVAVETNFLLDAALLDGTGSAGTLGQLLSSTITGTLWVNAPTAPVSEVFGRTGVVTAESTDYSSFYLSLSGGTLTGNLLFSADNTYTIGAFSATRPSTVYAGTSVLSPLFNAATGFQIAGAAASGHYLRGNGTDYVDGTIQAADVPTLNQSTTGNAATVTGLSVASGKTLTVDNSITLEGTDSTAFTFPSSSDTVVTLTATQTLTNKTLTAPVLGTPASGNLANCTFPTLNQNTTGTAGGLSGSPSISITNLAVSGTTSFASASIDIAALAHSTIALTDSTGLFTVTGSPASLGGTLTLSAFASQSQNAFLAGPASGGSGASAFRAMQTADLPTSGTWAFAGTLSGAFTLTGNTLQTSTDTLGLASYTAGVSNSPSMVIAGSYESSLTGPTYAEDSWTLQNVVGSGVNGTSTLTITHSGSTGTVQIKAPAVAGVYSWAGGTGGVGPSTAGVNLVGLYSGGAEIQRVTGSGIGVGGSISVGVATTSLDTSINRLAATSLSVGTPTAADWSGSLKASGLIGSSIALAPLANVGTVTVTPTGGSASTWTYVVVAKDANGNVCAASSAFSTTVGAATLTGAAFNTLTWTAIPGANSYDVYRTVHATSPTTTGKIGNVLSSVAVGSTGFKDTGLAGDSTTAPSFNLTGSIQLSASAAAPTSAGTPGTAGQILYNGGLLYFCSVSGAAGSATWNKLNMTAV